MLRVISLGAGVQSSTMALMADRGLFGDRPDMAVFADTGNEPRAVYDWLRWLQHRLSYPVIILTPLGDLSLMADAETMATYKTGDRAGIEYWRNLIPYFTRPKSDSVFGVPGMMNRKCTSNYKIRRLIRFCFRSIHPVAWRWWMRVGRKEGVKLVQQWIGISTDEADRMNLARNRWLENRHPLIEVGLSRAGCLQWMEKAGFPRPPKSACTFCPYHSDAQWADLQDNDPEAFQEAVEHEKRVQALAVRCPTTKVIPYLHRSAKPLDQVEFKRLGPQGYQATLMDYFNNECEGMCGV